MNVRTAITSIKINVPKALKAVEPKAKNALIPGVLIGSAGYQTYKDYKTAEKEDKRKLLLKNALMLGVTTLATVVCGRAGEKLLGKSKVFGDITKPVGHALKEVAEDAIYSIGGIAAGILGGHLIEKAIPLKKNNNDFEHLDNDLSYLANAENGFDGMTKAYTIAGSEYASRFNGSMATLAGFSISKQNGFMNKIKASVFEVVANIAVPSLFIVPASMGIEHLKGKGVKINNLAKALAYIPVVAAGFFTGSRVGNWFNGQIFDDGPARYRTFFLDIITKKIPKINKALFQNEFMLKNRAYLAQFLNRDKL